MVSMMTSDDLERVFAEHLDKTGRTGRVPGRGWRRSSRSSCDGVRPLRRPRRGWTRTTPLPGGHAGRHCRAARQAAGDAPHGEGTGRPRRVAGNHQRRTPERQVPRHRGRHTDRGEIVEGFIARWPNATGDNVKRCFVQPLGAQSRGSRSHPEPPNASADAPGLGHIPQSSHSPETLLHQLWGLTPAAAGMKL